MGRMARTCARAGLAVGSALLLLAGAALGADNEVRLPVEKTARISPIPEPAKPEARPDAKAEAPKAETPKPEAPRAHKAEPAQDVATPRPKPIPVPMPPAAPASEAVSAAPKPAPKPAPTPPPPAPVVDPLALETPPAQEAKAPVALPAEGLFAGDVTVEFRAAQVVLRLPTNAPVERVTFFNVKSPRKLAADLRGPWRKKGAPVLRFDTGPVKAVVAGEHPDRLRLAIEFREGAVAPDMEPQVELGPQGVTLTIPLAVRLKP